MIGLPSDNKKRSQRESALAGSGKENTSLPETTHTYGSTDRLTEAILEAADVAIATTDHRGCFIKVNQAYCKLHGYPREELIGRHFSMLVPEADRASASEKYQLIFKTGVMPKDNEWKALRKDGVIRDVDIHINLIQLESGERQAVTTARDITESKKNRLLLSDARGAVKIGSWEYDIHSGSLTISDEIYQILHIPTNFELCRENIRKLVSQADFEKLLDAFHNAVQEGSAYDLEVEIITPGNQRKWVRTTCKPDRIQGRIVKLYGLLQDITQQKQAEQELRKLSLVASKTNNGVLIIDANKTVEWVNESFSRITGFNIEEVQDKAYVELLKHSSQQEEIEQIEAKLNEGKPFKQEIEIRHKEGKYVWLNIDITPVRDHKLELTRYVAILTEITEQKLAEVNDQFIKESFRALAQTFPDSILMILDRSFQVVFTEGKELQVFGIHQDEAIGKSLSEILDQEAAGVLQAQLKNVFEGHPTVFDTRYEGRYYTLSAVPLQEEDQAIEHILILCNNITGRLHAQHKLRQSEAILKRTQTLARIGNWEYSVARNKMSCSEEIFRIFEDKTQCKSIDFKGQNSRIYPEDLSRYRQTIQQAIETGAAFNTDLRIVTGSRQTKYVQVIGEAITNFSGKVVKLRGSLMDITERALAAEQIREREEWFKTIFNASRDGFVVEFEEHIYYVNEAYARMYGYDSAEELVGKHISIVQAEEDNQMMLDFGQRRLQGEQVPAIYEAKGRRKDNSIIEVEISASVFRIKDKEFIISIERNIAERKQAQQKLQHRLALEHLVATISTKFINVPLEELNEALHVALREVGEFNQVDRAYLFQFSHQGTLFHETHEWCKEGILSTQEDLQYLPVSQFPWLLPKLQKFETVHIADVAKLPPEAKAEKDHFQKEDIKSLLLFPIAYSNELIGFVGFDSVQECKVWKEEDIVLLRVLGEIFGNALQKKKTDLLLNNQRKYLRLIIDTDPNIIFVKDAQGRYQMANNATAELYSCTVEELLGKEDADFNGDPKQVKGFLSDDELVLRTKQSVVREEVFTSKKTGKTTFLRTVKKPLFNADGSVSVLGVAVNITESKQYEETITASLHEKEVLLKEIHHRVKNNMAVISGLLSLQSNYISDPEAKEIFRESQNRIKSMALIHEKLYQSESLARIEFSSYIKDLTNSIMVFNRSNAARIELKIFAPEVMLDVNSAVPLGLIVNELLSNAYKHAFKGREEGTIELHFNKEEGQYRLVISDNGIGIANHQNLENADSLGITLIYALASQLGAKVELYQTEGSTFVITFEEKEQRRAK